MLEVNGKTTEQSFFLLGQETNSLEQRKAKVATFQKWEEIYIWKEKMLEQMDYEELLEW